MEVTVGICTWNRAALLKRTLETLAKVRIPADIQWRVIVGDNNSTDQTAEVVKSFQHALPVRRLFTPAQGKSHALNAITEQLDGDLVIWLDDDVLVDSNLVQAYVEAARNAPHADFFGGQITPHFLAPEPEWMRPAWSIFSGVWGERKLGSEAFDFNEGVLPFGANMAARVSLQKQYRYDPNLGRVGNLLLAGEETVIMQQWLGDGYRGRYVPTACVEHLVTPERMTLEFVERFYFSHGKSLGRLSQLDGFELLRLASQAMRYGVKSRLISRKKYPESWARAILRSCSYWGQVDTHWPAQLTWLKPPPLRRHCANKNQPRYKADPNDDLSPVPTSIVSSPRKSRAA